MSGTSSNAALWNPAYLANGTPPKPLTKKHSATYIIEPLPSRIQITPTVTFAPIYDPGLGYTLTLLADEQDNIDHWGVNWGDSTSSTLASSTGSLTHVYFNPNASYNITATAYDTANNPFQSLFSISGSEHLDDLTIQNADGVLGEGQDKVLDLNSLTLLQNGSLDIGDNTVIVHATAATRFDVLRQLTNYIHSAYNEGAWNGIGLTSSLVYAGTNGGVDPSPTPLASSSTPISEAGTPSTLPSAAMPSIPVPSSSAPSPMAIPTAMA